MDLASFAEKCSDWETDDEKKEQFSPWPSFIHEEILTERARLRVAMKDDMKSYKRFIDTHLAGFSEWWKRLDETGKTRVFQMTDEEVMDFFRIHARVKGSYDVVLCAIMKQVKHFAETGYRDGRINAEMYFEQFLQYRRGVFLMDFKYINSPEGAANFIQMLQVLGGPKLLPVRQTRDPREKTEAEAEQAKSEANVQSFRSDRRLVRLVIFRKFADIAIRKYMREVVNTTDDGTPVEPIAME
ncbi:hypothetical protein FI667_g14540, partial [Globisporangium splendens]